MYQGVHSMSVKVERIPGEPVIVATLVGKVTAELVLEMFEQSARLAAQIPGQVYRITDVRLSTTTFHEMVTILAEACRQKHTASSADPRFCGMLLGSHEWSQMYSESLKQDQHGKLNLPVFTSFNEAMQYITHHREIEWQH
jgi:hypothetical protein